MFQLMILSGTVEYIGGAAWPVGTGIKFWKIKNRKMAHRQVSTLLLKLKLLLLS